MTTPIDSSELALPVDWDHTTDDIMVEEDLVSATSHEEANKVFEQWQADDQDHELDIMEVDEQLGSNLLGDEIFHDPCASPTGPLEELESMNIDVSDIDRFSLSLLSDCEEDENLTPTTTAALPFDERYKETLKKLAESMKRSQETRKSLTIKTDKTETYSRHKSVTGVLTSIEKSSQQLQAYLSNIQRI